MLVRLVWGHENIFLNSTTRCQNQTSTTIFQIGTQLGQWQPYSIDKQRGVLHDPVVSADWQLQQMV